MFDNYGEFWKYRPARPVLIWSVVGRLPLYLTSLAIALVSIRSGDSLVRTGLLLAAYSVGSAVAGPIVARTIDRFGQTWPLVVTASLHVLAVVSFAALPLGQIAVVAVAAIAGATIPPTSTSLRALWGTLPLGDDGRRGAFALEAILGEIFVICGPIALSVSLLFLDARMALLIGSGLTALGAFGVAATGASRGWRAQKMDSRHLLGPLSHGAFLLLVVVLLLAAAGGGTFTLLLPAFSEASGTPDAAGLLFGAWGIGSVIGGFWFGSRSPAAQNTGKLFLIGLGAVGLGLALPLLAWDLWSMLAAVVIGGVAIAPASIVEYEMIQRLAPRAYLTEAFTWVQTANVAGSAVGAQLAGVATAAGGLTAGFAVSPTLVALAVLIALFSSSRWKPILTAQESVAAQSERKTQ